LKQNLQLLKFDSSKGCSDSIDLSDVTKLEMRIYKPRYVVDIVGNLPGLTEPIKCSIELTEEQSLAVAALKTDAEREAFKDRLLTERQQEIRDAITAALQARNSSTR
jgi:hypothetical protein